MFSLESWLIDGKKPEIMPAVYEFYNYLGNHSKHSFDAVIAHPQINKTIDFPNGSKIHIHKLNVPFYYVRKFTSTIFLKRKAIQLLDDNKDYDVVYGMTIYANVAKTIGEKHNLFSVGRLFGSLIWDVMQKGQWLKAKTRFHYQLREIKDPCDLTICTEDGTQFDLAISKYASDAKVHMLYNGVNEDLRQMLLALPSVQEIDSGQEIRFCYIARLTYWKRQDIALDIISQLKDKGLKVKLDIYGKGETLDFLHKRVKKLGLDQEVSVKGSVPHERMPEVLSQYHVSMFMYDASNLGNAMWESALAGRVIFTRDTGKTAYVFNDTNAIMVNDLNLDNAVKEFVDILDRDISLADNSRDTVNELLPNWNHRFDREMKLISSAK